MDSTREMTSKQARRVLEQAARSRAEIWLEPHEATDPATWRGHVTELTSSALHLDLIRAVQTELLLVGACCEARLWIDAHVYVFSTWIQDVSQEAPPALRLGLPEVMYVFNRRRHERTAVSIASQVHLWPAGAATAIVGLLTNISPGGASALFPDADAAAQLLIDDPVRLSFEIAGFEERFDLPAVVCSKSHTADRTSMNMGLEFQVPEGDVAAERCLARLEATLAALITDMINLEGDA